MAEPAPDLPNARIAEIIDELGDLYELDGAIVHRVLAYRNGAKAVRDATRSVAALTRAGTVTELPGIGKTLEEKLKALLDTGTIPALEKLRAKFPPGLLAMTRLPGLGPKRARKLYDELGIDSLDALATAAQEQKLRGVKGFGPKFEEAVLAAIAAGHGEERSRRVPLHRAMETAGPIVDALRAHPASDEVHVAGSARRMADSVKDLDVIATASDPRALLEAFAALPDLQSAGTVGDNAVKGVTHNGLSIDVRVVEPGQLGNLLQHFTGSKNHNLALRAAAVRKGLHVSEYGITDDATGETHRCATEEEVYALLGLPLIPPELREDRGELAFRTAADVPALVTQADLRGDLHMHTIASDGRGTIREMAEAARDRGLDYIAITDHSASHGFGNDVSPDELRRQIERVRQVDAEVEGITVLAGSEVNILPDGSLDYADDLLAELDWVVASVHTQFAMDEAAMTKRIVAALEHPSVYALGHPTGRKIEQRQAYAVDMDAVIDAAARTGTFLEINSAPDRRDLHDVHARAAAAAGVLIVIDSDAHGPEKLGVTSWGVGTARRAWLTAAQVANTRSWTELDALRKQG
ncbi:DNA polymerase/3'-5' exonuclease PolX [Paraconexibacter antarcticus]|uniref:DNA-directed DNA polymerase n=1 Tax=Paraconexibacter antarcticus TaxID=2949664 RepID=A0ABY5DT60_9ACTN|nr:DNA polymerase/3'-5' exonuclease PolX [Paraconexibacter antarcticus]UTI64453.1 DNA polymerase/3'-5' exonuclease PolX [Paraconexibacter antarcticus]